VEMAVNWASGFTSGMRDRAGRSARSHLLLWYVYLPTYSIHTVVVCIYNTAKERWPRAMPWEPIAPTPEEANKKTRGRVPIGLRSAYSGKRCAAADPRNGSCMPLTLFGREERWAGRLGRRRVPEA